MRTYQIPDDMLANAHFAALTAFNYFQDEWRRRKVYLKVCLEKPKDTTPERTVRARESANLYCNYMLEAKRLSKQLPALRY